MEIRFATNEIVIAYSEKAKYAAEINSQTGWIFCSVMM